MGSAEGSSVGSSWPEPMSPLPLPWASQESHRVFRTTQEDVDAKFGLLRSQLAEFDGRVGGRALIPHSLESMVFPFPLSFLLSTSL
jgi:hypothetical protein